MQTHEAPASNVSFGSKVDTAKFAEIGPQFETLVGVAYCGKIPAEFGSLP